MRHAYRLVLLALLLSGCGYKGALYLPQKPPEAQPRQDKPAIPSPPENKNP